MKGVRKVFVRHQAAARLTCEKERDALVVVLDLEKALPASLDRVVEERLTGAL
jgi:hypothetical protein